MNTTIEGLLYLAVSLFLLAAGGILLLFINRYLNSNHTKTLSRISHYLSNGISLGNPRKNFDFVVKNAKQTLRIFLELSQTFKFEKNYFLLEDLRRSNIQKRYYKDLSSWRKFKRIAAAVYLGALPSLNSQLALENALKKEQNYLVRLYICNSLVDITSPSSIPLMINSLIGAPLWYRNKVSTLLCSYGQEFHHYASDLLTTEDIEIQGLLIDFSAIFPADNLKNFLLLKTQSSIKDIAYRSTRTLGIFYYPLLNDPCFLNHPDPVIRNITIQALAQIITKENIITLMPLLGDIKCEKSAIVTISNIAAKQPKFLDFLIKEFYNADQLFIKNSLGKILANRMEYLLAKLNSPGNENIKTLVGDIVKLGKTSSTIGFLNKNKSIELENDILDILRPISKSDMTLQTEFSTYLPPRILEKLDLQPIIPPVIIKSDTVDKNKFFFLYTILCSAVLLFPLIYFYRHWDSLLSLSWLNHVKQYVLDFNYYVAYYSLTINTIYIILLLFSFCSAYQQRKYWKIKKNSFLFKPRIMPSISIIAPAFCEETTIIESANSLLNLRYPNYELIIVNDGSTDNTLHKLITSFNLEKVDILLYQRLQTKPVRGIYVNPSIPNLIVVDKANGGKADSLNAGINISTKEFFCGIDADSLLESDALLKLASMVIDSPYEAVALGGNIFPINGCRVDKGMITSTKIPTSFLGRLQTIEYLRAFMAGRLGWAYLNSLLIISGAFGLFRKDRVIEIGGYLTSSERYKQDTVGEDMELVTRLTRHLTEKKQQHSIHYSYNANCWTEIPESLVIFKRQRDRWQRGLLDVISFHRKLILNPRYGKIGLIAMPYFFFFETFGPFIEIQGYIMIFLAIILGLFNQEIALLLFISSILMGIIISIFSLVIAEKKTSHYSMKEILLLLLYTIIENFGPRQLISCYRIIGYINALKKPIGWGQMNRKGFTTTKEVSTK